MADVDFTHQAGNVLVVLITGFGLGNGHLIQTTRVEFYHAELGDVATILIQSFNCPGGHNVLQVAAGDTVLFFENIGVFLRVEQAKGGFKYRRAFDGVERYFLHQML